MKRIICLLLTLLLIASCSVPVFSTSVDFSYSGVIDPVTGMPDSSVSDVGYGEQYIRIVNGIYYDVSAQEFCYSISGGENVLRSNVMNGMIVTDPVTISLTEGFTGELFRNGVAAEGELSPVTEPGSYCLNMSENGVSRTVLSFTIVSENGANIEAYTVPAGFFITEVYLDGVLVQSETDTADLTKEGTYSIDYFCYLTQMPYHLVFTIDHTPPVLALAEVDENSIAHGPVDISDLEENCQISITCNDKEVSYSGRLTESGNYYIVLCDAAGNRNSYAFTIQVYFNASSIIFFGIIILLAVLLVIFIFRSRGKTRVR